MNVNLRLLKLLFLWWGVGVVGLQSLFHVKPNYSVEVVLCFVVVEVVTIVS